MDDRPGLTQLLATLSAAMDVADIDLRVELELLNRYLSNTIASSLGLTLTVPLNGTVITLTTTRPSGAGPGASLRIPLGRNAGGPASTQVVFFASTPGAFVDLAADAQWVNHLGGAIILDGHLHPGQLGARVPTDITDTADVNQAIGALIERGNLPPAARRELARLASAASTSIPQAARALLDGLGSVVRA